MKKCLTVFLLVIIMIKSSAQVDTVQQFAPDVYYYFGDEMKHRSANCVWIVFNEYVLVIDANYPWGAKDIIGEIRKTTTKPIRFVFNTHYHHDHSFGNGIFADAGATIIATSAAATEMKTLGRNEWQQNYSGQPLDGYTQVFPSLTFDSVLVFDDSIHRVELIKMGPAHTAGDAVAFLPKEKILVTGDLFVNGNPWGNNVADPHAQYDRWLTVLDNLLSWRVETIVPGHGGLASKKELRNQRAYLADMLKQVRAGIKKGLSKEQLAKKIDLGKYPVYGANKVSTDRSVRAMYDNLSVKKK